MTHRLVQKHFLHGVQELELRDDSIRVTISKPFQKKKEIDVVLAMLNPEPVVHNSQLHFHSRVKCGPLISLYLDKPNPEEFAAFVDAVKAKAQAEFDAFAGLKS